MVPDDYTSRVKGRPRYRQHWAEDPDERPYSQFPVTIALAVSVSTMPTLARTV